MLRAWDGPGDALLIAFAFGASIVAADVVSGVVHWLADRIVPESVPYLGPNFVAPFRAHHVDPEDITRHDFVETNGNTCIALLPVGLAISLWLEPSSSLGALAATSFAVGFATWVALTNAIHRWAHMAVPPAVVRGLQGAGLLLSPAHHAEHHAAPFDRRFCITTGWSNAALDRAKVFEKLEAVAADAVRSIRRISRPGPSAPS